MAPHKVRNGLIIDLKNFMPGHLSWGIETYVHIKSYMSMSIESVFVMAQIEKLSYY